MQHKNGKPHFSFSETPNSTTFNSASNICWYMYKFGVRCTLCYNSNLTNKNKREPRTHASICYVISVTSSYSTK